MRLQQTDDSLEMVGLDGASDFGIDPENWGMAIKKFYDYSDPTGSIVREVTSNAIDGLDEAKAFKELDIATLIEEGWAKEVYKDVYRRMMGGRTRPAALVGLSTTEDMRLYAANVEAYEDAHNTAVHRATKDWYEEVTGLQAQFKYWQEVPVKVAIEETRISDLDKPEYSFTVTDRGIGLSPLRVRDIYSKFFSSTKRETSRQMGAFGLGAKSPLGYAESFILDSWYNGKHYSYVIFRGAAAPKIEIINVEDTDLPNGVKVSVPIEDKDVDKFKVAVKKQLAYFDRVAFENVGMEDFAIYKAKTFVYRNPPPSANIHLCLGRVFYPLDLDILGIGKFSGNYPEVPMGLRFGVHEVGSDNEPGKISILWNRESIQYNEETIKAIKIRLQEAKDELQTIWNTSTSDISSVEEYFDVLESPKSSLEVGEGVVMSGLNSMIAVQKTYPKYGLLKKLPDSDLFFAWKVFRVVEYGKLSSAKTALPSVKRCLITNNNAYIAKRAFYRASHLMAPSAKKNAYLSWKGIDNFYIIKKNHELTEMDIFRQFGYSDFRPPTEDEKILIDNFMDEVDEYIYGISLSYDDVTPSKEYEDYLKELKRQARAIKQEKVQRGIHEFPIKRLTHDNSNSNALKTEYSWIMESMTVDRAAEATALIVYGFQEEDALLKTAAAALFSSPAFYTDSLMDRLDSRRADVLKIGRSSEEYFTDNPHAIHVNTFMTESKVVKRFVTATIMKERLPRGYHILHNDTIKAVEPRLYKYIKILTTYIHRATNNSHTGMNPVNRVTGFTPDLLDQYAKMDRKRRQLITLARKKKTRLPIPDEVYDSSILDVYKKVMVYLDTYPLLLTLKYPTIHSDMDLKGEALKAYETSIKEYLSLRRVTNPELLIRLRKERQKV